MSSGKTKLLTPNTMATLSFVFLLTIHLPLAYAAEGNENVQISTARSDIGFFERSLIIVMR